VINRSIEATSFLKQGETQRSDSFFPASRQLRIRSANLAALAKHSHFPFSRLPPPVSLPPVSFVSRIDFLWIGFINFHAFVSCGSDGNMERRLGTK
jgi:hypothetical protein